MMKLELVQFQSHLAEAENILEAANAREITRVEAAIAEANQTLERMRISHSEVLTFIKTWSARMEQGVTNMMTDLIEREIRSVEDYHKRLAELREVPPPKLVVSE